jgi:L1 cell adhesion molecule like protein
LGIQLKNEIQHDEMISILETLQELSPRCHESDDNVYLQGVLLGGDQLSCSMARCVIADRKNSVNDTQCLNGIIPVVEDWHGKLCLLTVSD